ncbi:U-box domain-containing protein 4 [Hordeum vulgare]|nr:U-box domain-containing protein 4 [Hordeum vulgare]
MPQGKGLELEFMVRERWTRGKRVLPSLEKGKEVVPPLVDVRVQDHPNTKRCNYENHHEEARPTHFCKVIFAPKLEALPLPLDFTKQFLTVPTEFNLKTSTDCSWRVTWRDTVKVVDDRVILNQDWATFAVVHRVKIRYMLTSNLLTWNTMKVNVFNDDDMEVVTKCKKHDEALVVIA